MKNYTWESQYGARESFKAKSDLAAKRIATAGLAFGCGDMVLLGEDGKIVGIRRFWQCLNRFGWDRWS